MKDLTGYMTINGKDAWAEYSAFLCEDREEDNFNFSELLKPLEMKEYTAVDFRERNGEELPESLPSSCYKARDVTLYFAIYASSPEECETRRAALMKVMYSGWVNLQVKGKTSAYKFYYKSSSDFDTVTDVASGMVVERWKMKFREPKPGTL
uniref:Uncharacterized protein n=1 Tax=Myoviridae sp. ctgpD8 TaxID=2825149 RepID=A0A8S5QIB0_9CAUD|nr:MAG TPA: hypothetical protein [Myoviridae sp. ctgpD8]